MSDVPPTVPVESTLAIIMGGGAGTRLFPLTKERAKPAVPLGGKYRLVDIPISNCLNSGIRSIYVLTQFNSMSLHQHINSAFKFDNFTPSFVEILGRPADARWLALVSGNRRRCAAEFALLPRASVRLLHHPQRRSTLPHGLSRSSAPACRNECGSDRRHYSGGPKGGDGFRDHAHR